MIHGDIDLTEDLDFYRDRKSPEYKNSRDFQPPALRNNNNHIWNTNDNLISSTSSTLSLSYSNYNSTWNINTSINNLSTFNSNYVTWNEYPVTTTSYNRADVWSEPVVTYDDEGTLHMTSTCTISYNNGNNFYINIPVNSSKPTVCQKLFGLKENKFHRRIYSLCELFGKRNEVYYENTNDFKNYRDDEDDYYTGPGMKYLTWWSIQRDPREIARERIYRLFGNKEDPYLDDEDDGCPWLNDLRRRDSRAYRNYMEELYGNEEEVDLSYLTNYNWLRMR